MLPKPEVDPLAPTFAMHCASWQTAAADGGGAHGGETSSMAMQAEMAAISLEIRDGAPASPTRRNDSCDRRSLNSSVTMSERALEEECAFLLDSSGITPIGSFTHSHMGSSYLGNASNLSSNVGNASHLDSQVDSLCASTSPPARRGIPVPIPGRSPGAPHGA